MAMYQVKITLQAKEHLALIRDYIAIQLKAPETAKNILYLFQKHMNSLSFMPQRISCIEESPWRENGIRKINASMPIVSPKSGKSITKALSASKART